MSNMTILILLTGLIVLSGIFLTLSWHKYVWRKYKNKKEGGSHSH